MIARTAEAEWTGTLREGSGTMRTASGGIEGRFSFGTRFKDAAGTNPEELIGAAHAGCYSMALASTLEKSGYKPERIQTTARVQLEQRDGSYSISRVQLKSEAKVPGIDAAKFRTQAEEAARNCVISKALSGTSVELEAHLAS